MHRNGVVRDPETQGWSPKAVIPAGVGIVTGIFLLILGSFALNDSTLASIGLGVVLAALGHLGIAYAAPAGDVKVPALAHQDRTILALKQDLEKAHAQARDTAKAKPPARKTSSSRRAAAPKKK